jgi:hypothetical protein
MTAQENLDRALQMHLAADKQSKSVTTLTAVVQDEETKFPKGIQPSTHSEPARIGSGSSTRVSLRLPIFI